MISFSQKNPNCKGLLLYLIVIVVLKTVIIPPHSTHSLFSVELKSSFEEQISSSSQLFCSLSIALSYFFISFMFNHARSYTNKLPHTFLYFLHTLSYLLLPSHASSYLSILSYTFQDFFRTFSNLASLRF